MMINHSLLNIITHIITHTLCKWQSCFIRGVSFFWLGEGGGGNCFPGLVPDIKNTFRGKSTWSLSIFLHKLSPILSYLHCHTLRNGASFCPQYVPKGLFTRREGYPCARVYKQISQVGLLCPRFELNLEVLYGKDVKFRKKREQSYYHGIQKIRYIVQMFIIKLRNWIIPFKLSRSLVAHEEESCPG